MPSAPSSPPIRVHEGHCAPDEAINPGTFPAAKSALIRCWAILNFPAGKRLQPFLPHLVVQLERHGELTLEPAMRERLLTMNADSIDRFHVSESS